MTIFLRGAVHMLRKAICGARVMKRSEGDGRTVGSARLGGAGWAAVQRACLELVGHTQRAPCRAGGNEQSSTVPVCFSASVCWTDRLAAHAGWYPVGDIVHRQ